MVALGWVLQALQAGAALVIEDLRGLRGRIAASMPKRMRRRLNHWSIRTFHAILRHKARVYGVPLLEMDPRGTRSTCPVCGGDRRGGKHSCVPDVAWG